jgi:hypothetical protein
MQKKRSFGGSGRISELIERAKHLAGGLREMAGLKEIATVHQKVLSSEF